MKRSQRMFYFLVAGAVVVGFLSMTTFAAPPRAAGKKATKKAAAHDAAASASEAKPPTEARSSSPRGGNGLDKRDVSISKERAEAAMRFARKHHSELAELLEGLRKSNGRHFQAGLRVLTRDAERLEKMVDRKDERYPVSLNLWKLDSRIRLEIARLSMSPGEDFEPRLRPLMEERQLARVRLLQMERRRSAERLAKYDEQLKTLQTGSDDLVSSEIERLKKTVALRAKAKSSRTPTSKETASATAKRKPSNAKTSRAKNLPTTSAD
ncbi:MAG: hypothetical protein ACI8P0_003824 [Planctomycetaceae bacterium]|jgi:hypothetical protein